MGQRGWEGGGSRQMDYSRIGQHGERMLRAGGVRALGLVPVLNERGVM